MLRDAVDLISHLGDANGCSIKQLFRVIPNGRRVERQCNILPGHMLEPALRNVRHSPVRIVFPGERNTRKKDPIIRQEAPSNLRFKAKIQCLFNSSLGLPALWPRTPQKACRRGVSGPCPTWPAYAVS